MRKYTSCIGRMAEMKHDRPECTAYRLSREFGGDVLFQVWPNRASMAKTIRMQQRRERKTDDWKAVVALKDGEGY